MKGLKHMVIHIVYNICTAFVTCSINPDETIFCVTLLNSEAKPLEGYNRCYIDHSSVMGYIYKNMGKQNRFLKSTVKEESVGHKFISRNTSHVLQSLHLS